MWTTLRSTYLVRLKISALVCNKSPRILKVLLVGVAQIICQNAGQRLPNVVSFIV